MGVALESRDVGVTDRVQDPSVISVPGVRRPRARLVSVISVAGVCRPRLREASVVRSVSMVSLERLPE